MKIGNKEFKIGERPYVMGILNVTPDSFSDGGKFNDMDKALFHAEEMIKQGADIIDVGGESTRPGHIKISDEEEIERVCPVISAIKERFDISVTLDTYKSAVADAGLSAGADMINDIWGLKWDEKMAGVIAGYNKGVILMHNRFDTDYKDFVSDVVNDLKESVSIAQNAGIDMNQVMIDPGVGFAKDVKQNLMIVNNLSALTALGYPVLLATSRKSFIGLTLDLPSDNREEGTIATSVMGLMMGCSFFRVHDVEKNVRALKMCDAILKS